MRTILSLLVDIFYPYPGIKKKKKKNEKKERKKREKREKREKKERKRDLIEILLMIQNQI